MKKRQRNIRLLRAGIQLLFFIFAPALFSTAFAGIKSIFQSLAAHEAITWNSFLDVTAVLLVITCLFGRHFCGYACAFGSLGDALYELTVLIRQRIFHKKGRHGYSEKNIRILQKVKYIWLAVLLGSILAGWYGKLQGMSPWDVFSMLTAGRLPGGTYKVGILLLILLMIGMCTQERFFCQFLCPMGAVFAIMPIVPSALFNRDRNICPAKCGACKKRCPAHLDIDGDTPLSGECICCHACQGICPKKNIRLGILCYVDGQSERPLPLFRENIRMGKRDVCRILCSSLLLTGIMGTALGKTTTAVFADDIEKYTNVDFAMNTVVSETLYTTGEDINTHIGEKLREMESSLLSWTDENSQISRLNNADGRAVEVSSDLAADLEKIRQLSEDSGGAFDPTLGKIIRLWDIDGENPHVPDQSELDALLPETGYEKIQLDGNTVTLLDGCTLDLGAVGKGLGCDLIMDYLQTQPDVSGMILNLGGSSVMTYGEKPDGSSWKVALTDPRDVEGDYLGAITLEADQYLSTSGDYEKYFIQDGIRYHHILDPKTGCPVWNGLTSVTIICSQGYLADGLSTACFVLGLEEAKPLLEKYGAEAIFVDEDKNVYVTDGLMDKFELMKDGYTVKEA